MPEYEVILGEDESGRKIKIGDIERRSGLYIVGVAGSGKTTILKNIIAQDMDHGHGVFFLDPHGDAIDDLQKHIPAHRKDDVIVLDVRDRLYSFGMNLLACANPDDMTEREDTYNRALAIFTKLFADPQTGNLAPWLNKFLQNSFYPLIVNQGYTIAEIPLFIQDKQFRDRLLQHPAIEKDYPDVVRFWQTEFEQLPKRDQRNEIESTLTRLGAFTRPHLKHIVGQPETTLDFFQIMEERKILFLKLSAKLPRAIRESIGTILIRVVPQ